MNKKLLVIFIALCCIAVISAQHIPDSLKDRYDEMQERLAKYQTNGQFNFDDISEDDRAFVRSFLEDYQAIMEAEAADDPEYPEYPGNSTETQN